MSLREFLTRALAPKPKEEEKLPAKADKDNDPEMTRALTKEKKNYILSEDQKLLVVRMIAQHMSASEIVRESKIRYGIDVSYRMISNYRNAEKWQPMIKKIREQYLSDMADVGGAHKKVRLARADRIYARAFANGDLKNGITALEHQRREMEEQFGGNTLSLTLNQYNLMTDAEIDARREELLKVVTKNQKKEEVIDVEPGTPKD